MHQDDTPSMRRQREAELSRWPTEPMQLPYRKEPTSVVVWALLIGMACWAIFAALRWL